MNICQSCDLPLTDEDIVVKDSEEFCPYCDDNCIAHYSEDRDDD